MRPRSLRRAVWTAVVFAVVIASPVVLQAQVDAAPTQIEFEASADHDAKLPDGRAAVSRYDLAVYCGGDSSPVAVVNLGKPAHASDGMVVVDFRSRLASVPPTGVACAAVVRAVGPEGATDSVASDPFVFENAARRTRGDFDGDGDADLAVFRYGDGTWTVNGQGAAVFGEINDIPVPAEYDGEPGDERAVYRPDTSEWFIEGEGAAVWGQVGDIPVPGDYNGDGRAELAVFRPSTGQWLLQGRDAEAWGRPGDIPVPGDYDGDGRADLAVYRPTTSAWYIQGSPAFTFGAVGDIPVPADYDGNGTIDAAVYRRSTRTWYVRGQFSRAWGAREDLPVPQDLNGDGRAELVLWRPSQSKFYALYGTAANTAAIPVGSPGDLPVLGPPHLARGVAFDVDGDRRAEIGVYRPSALTWYMRLSRDGFSTAPAMNWTLALSADNQIAPGDYDGDRLLDAAVCTPAVCRIQLSRSGETVDVPGLDGAMPVPADYDGDGRTDLALFRRGEGLWRVFLSSTGFSESTERVWGRGSLDIPVPGDFNGDGRADYAVFRPTNGGWYISYSSGGSTSMVRGRNGDIPFAREFDGDGLADLVVYRPSTRQWFIWKSSVAWKSYTAITYGAAGDVPVPADYNGDGLCDLGQFRPSTGQWSLRGVATRKLGMGGDIALARVQ